MSSATFGKPLKGLGTLSPKFTKPIEQTIYTTISSGGISLNNVEISGGTIDGVTIGNSQPGPGYFTEINIGGGTGVGYQVCFYGNTVGDVACWLPIPGRWNINGDLYVRDISDLGNLRLVSNTISSTNINGNIILDPNGTGIVSVVGPLSQTTSTGNISLNTSSGNYTLTTLGGTITSTSGTNTSFLTQNGNINLQTGTNTSNISNISTGSTVTITTTSNHGLITGDIVTIAGTNSTPNINGVYTVVGVPTLGTLTITPGYTVTSSGNSGTIQEHSNINLNSNTINLTASTSINIPEDTVLTLGDTLINIVSNGTDLTLNNGLGGFIINSNTTMNGNLVVNGTTITVNSTIVTIDDPIFTLGGDTDPLVNDSKDRGIEFRWHNGSVAKRGFFGMDDSTNCFVYIPEATNISEVFSGTPGCARFGGITGTSLNLQGGNITSISTLDACNLNCSGTMTITGSTAINIVTPTLSMSGDLTVNGINTTINSTNVQIEDPIITLGEGTVDDNKDRGIEYKWNDGVNEKLGFIGTKNSTGNFTFIPDAVNTDEVITGAPGNAEFGDIFVNDITVNGIVSVVGGAVFSTEYLDSPGGGIINPSFDKHITFISILSSGIVTGTLPSTTTDGFPKFIMIYSMASNSEYHLSVPAGRLLDPGSGNTNAKTIKFKFNGQSIYLIWSNTASCYMIVNSGAFIE